MPQKTSRLTTERMRELHGQGVPVREIAKRAGLSHPTVMRRLSVDKIRRADDFRGLPDFTPPRRESAHTSWSLDAIRAARDAQMHGHFKLAVRLAEAMRTDDAIFVARRNRLAPQTSVALTLKAHDSARGRAVARKAALGVKLSRQTIASLHAYLVDNAVAIGYNRRTPNTDGTRVDFEHIAWPLEHVRWNPSKECLETPTRGGLTVPIVHGDGNFTIYRKSQVEPWKEDAAVLAGSLVWASHAEGMLDWNATTRTHALAKLIGELPAGVPMQQRNPDGSMGITPEAEMFGRMLGNLMSGASQVGIRPAGSKTEFEANPSTAWQVIDQLITNREKAAARIFLGTDAILGSQGGAPGVDIAALFAIASPVLQTDFEALESGFFTGVYQPWTAINHGDSSLAPCLEYQLPDPDLARKIEEESKKHTALVTALKEHRDAGFTVDQLVVNTYAAKFQVDPIPKLAATAPPAQKLDIAPTQRALYTFANEARGSDGLQSDPLFEKKTLAQLEAEAKASATPAEPTAPGGAPSLAVPKARGLRQWAGRKFDESKISRAEDGKFGSGPGTSKGGGGRKGGGSDDNAGDAGAGDDESADNTPAGKAERRLAQAREQHTKAVEAHAAAEQRFEAAKADALSKLDARVTQRAEAAKRAQAYADEIDAETKTLTKEQDTLDKQAEREGLGDEDDETNPHFDHPTNQRRREVRAQLSTLEDAPYDELRAEARMNARPDKKIEKARAALLAGDLDAVEEYSDAGLPNTEVSDDWGVRHDVSKAYREKYGVEPRGDVVDFLAERERGKRVAARPDTSITVSPGLGTPEEKADARAEAEARLARQGFTEPTEEDVARVTGYVLKGKRLTLHYESDLAPAQNEVERARTKVARAERAVRVHEREVKRKGGKVDADGDGRTGAAEAKDDAKP